MHNRDNKTQRPDTLLVKGTAMAYLPSLIASVYSHGHERQEVFRVESFDSENYSLLFLIVAKENPP